jgi:hypothetical protein
MPRSQQEVDKRMQILKDKHNEFISTYNKFKNNYKKYMNPISADLNNTNINVNTKIVSAPSS